MDYTTIHKGMRVRPVELFGELDIERAEHLNPGRVMEDPDPVQYATDPDPEMGRCESMIRVQHDDGKIAWHIADQLEAE